MSVMYPFSAKSMVVLSMVSVICHVIWWWNLSGIPCPKWDHNIHAIFDDSTTTSRWFLVGSTVYAVALSGFWFGHHFEMRNWLFKVLDLATEASPEWLVKSLCSCIHVEFTAYIYLSIYIYIYIHIICMCIHTHIYIYTDIYPYIYLPVYICVSL